MHIAESECVSSDEFRCEFSMSDDLFNRFGGSLFIRERYPLGLL
jgi:hypothetical protein